MKVNAYNRGLVAGYALANTATAEEKNAYVLEIRKYTPGLDAGDWGDSEKKNYVIEYAAKLRLHYLNNIKPYEPEEVPDIDIPPSEEELGPEVS
jgi:hypothetical protein